MFIAYVVIDVIGLLFGIFVFFLAMSLFGVYVKKAKTDLDEQQASMDSELAENSEQSTTDNTVENVDKSSPDRDNRKRELTDRDFDGVSRRKKMFTPLPALLMGEGALVFLFNVVMIFLKFKLENFVEFYVLLAVDVGVALLSVLVNSLVMSRYHIDEDEKPTINEHPTDDAENVSQMPENEVDNNETTED